jgi:hypothetical protein
MLLSETSRRPSTMQIKPWNSVPHGAKAMVAKEQLCMDWEILLVQRMPMKRPSRWSQPMHRLNKDLKPLMMQLQGKPRKTDKKSISDLER